MFVLLSSWHKFKTKQTPNPNQQKLPKQNQNSPPQQTNDTFNTEQPLK